MIIPGKTAAARRLITGLRDQAIQTQPCGVDLTVRHISQWTSSATVDFTNQYRSGSTTQKLRFQGDPPLVHLSAGSYLVEFHEQVDVPLNLMGQIFARSSLWRSGALLTAGVIDSGYQGALGALLQVMNPHGISIHQHARLAQVVFHEMSENVDSYVGMPVAPLREHLQEVLFLKANCLTTNWFSELRGITHTRAIDMDEDIRVQNLKQRLQLLPTELQDKIQDLTLHSFPEVAHIAPDYRPPAGLQINRKIRDDIARTFYATTAFQVTISNNLEHIKLLDQWLHSIPSQHRRYIKTIRIYRPKWTPDNGFGRVNSFALAELWDLREHFSNVDVPMDVLHINSRAGDGDTEEWWDFRELYEGKRKVGSVGKQTPVDAVTDILRAGWLKQ